MSKMNRGEKACASWGLLATKYNAATPTPPGISADLEVTINGNLVNRNVGEWRKMMEETLRRYPDWNTTIVQEFGDEDSGCTVWQGTAEHTATNTFNVSMHGVTILDVDDDGKVIRANLYFETDDVRSGYSSVLQLRAV